MNGSSVGNRCWCTITIGLLLLLFHKIKKMLNFGGQYIVGVVFAKDGQNHGVQLCRGLKGRCGGSTSSVRSRQ